MPPPPYVDDRPFDKKEAGLYPKEERVVRNGSVVYEPVVGPNGKIVYVKNLERKYWDEERRRRLAQGGRRRARKSRRNSRATRRRRY